MSQNRTDNGDRRSTLTPVTGATSSPSVQKQSSLKSWFSSIKKRSEPEQTAKPVSLQTKTPNAIEPASLHRGGQIDVTVVEAEQRDGNPPKKIRVLPPSRPTRTSSLPSGVAVCSNESQVTNNTKAARPQRRGSVVASTRKSIVEADSDSTIEESDDDASMASDASSASDSAEIEGYESSAVQESDHEHSSEESVPKPDPKPRTKPKCQSELRVRAPSDWIYTNVIERSAVIPASVIDRASTIAAIGQQINRFMSVPNSDASAAGNELDTTAIGLDDVSLNQIVEKVVDEEDNAVFGLTQRIQLQSHVQSNRYLCEYLDAYAQFHLTYAFPSWIDPRKITDQQGRTIETTGFDSTCIKYPSKIPVADKGHDTPAMKQYWTLKSINFDKILFFKVGKFYEIFYHDAVIAQKYCRLKWMAHDAKAHVGFPESSLYYHAKRLVDLGFKVSVVEQMETPKELEKRNASKTGKQLKEKAVRREVCEVMSKGTCVQDSMLSSENRYLCFINVDSITAVDGTLFIRMCALLADIATGHTSLEYLYEPLIHERILTNALLDLKNWYTIVEIYMMNDALPQRYRNLLGCNIEIHQFESPEDENYLQLLEKRLDTEFAHPSVLKFWKCPMTQSLVQQLLGCLQKSLLLEGFLGSCSVALGNLWASKQQDDAPLSLANNEADHPAPVKQTDMQLRSHVVEQLDLDVPFGIDKAKSMGSSPSLLAFMDQTVTPMGSRLLRQWIIAPLTDVHHIQERLDMTEWTHQVYQQLGCLSEKERDLITLKDVKDLQRVFVRLCSLGQQCQRQAVYFDNHPHKKLKDLMSFLTTIEVLAMRLFDALHASHVKLNGENALLPGIASRWVKDECLSQTLISAIQESRDQVVLETIAMTGSQVGLNVQEVYLPKSGLMPEFDKHRSRYYDILDAIEKKKSEWSKELGITFKFAHAKYKFELELSTTDSQKTSFKAAKKTNDWIVTSQKSGAVRIRPEGICDLVEELDEVAQLLSDGIYPLLKQVISIITDKRDAFNTLITRVSEWDIFLSYAKVMTQLQQTCDLPICKPTLISTKIDENVATSTPFLQCHDLCHPVLGALLAKQGCRFVPNDVRLGKDPVGSNSHRIMVLTGPNMGGKSTLLRSVSLMVLMAQIGCFVCASSCEFTPFSSIYTRLGAKDNLLEGKSTFLVELEETGLIFQDATSNNPTNSGYILALIDELGRGTSTFDGTAIALATLRKLSRDQHASLCFFSTHYHVISDLVENGNVPNALNCHMSTGIDANADAATSMNYGYKLLDGPCMKSLGINIATYSGLPTSIIERAKVMSDTIGTRMDKIALQSKLTIDK